MAKNNNNYYNSRPKDKKWVGKLVACVATGLAVVVAVCAMAVGTSGFKDWSFNRWFPKTETLTPAPEKSSEGGAVISEGESHGIRLMSAMVPEEEYATYGIDGRSVQNVFTLSVTYEPANTTYKATTFTGAFKNPSSAWATGKKVSDYVTITSTSDTTATAKVLQSFSEPIIITAQSKRTPTVKATRNLEYVGQYTGDFSGVIDDYGACRVGTIEDELEFKLGQFKDGTIAPSLTNCVTITFNFADDVRDTFVDDMKAYGYTVKPTVSKTITPSSVGSLNGVGCIYDILYEAGNMQNASDDERQDYWSAISDVFLGSNTPEDLAGSTICYYNFSFKRVYNGVTYMGYSIDNEMLLEDFSGFEVVATGVAMDNTPIVAG